MKTAFIIGVAGGSGSGKTTFAKKLFELLGSDKAVIIGQDSYYIDQSARFDGDGGSVNFDHPDAIEFSLLGEHLKKLKSGMDIEVPSYDFSTHKRIEAKTKIAPHEIIIVDGILILGQKSVRDQLDYAIFMDAPEEVRFERRLKRDVAERGRTGIGVYRQFYKQVKPMHDQFVETSKSFANKIVTTETFVKELNTLVNILLHNTGDTLT
jgi:uridine kinase